MNQLVNNEDIDTFKKMVAPEKNFKKLSSNDGGYVIQK